MNTSPISWTLARASEELKKGTISSVELTNACLEQIHRHDDKLGCFLLVDEEGALKEAVRSDERRKAGALLSKMDGIPVGVKDMMCTNGLKTTAASKILEDYVPPYDATVVKKLKEVGTVIVGKLNQDEFAMGSSNESSAYKLCRNPWNLEKIPGGSSGGSAAAVASGMCFGSLGTDTGGSIRLPASFCGLTGIRPTYGRVSRFGVVAYASSLDQVGPFAKDVKSTAMMLEAIAGFDERDSTSVNVPVPKYASVLNGDVKGLKVGVPKEYFGEGLSLEVKENVLNSIEILKAKGAIIQDVSLPLVDYAIATYYIIATAEASSNLSRYDGVRFGPRLGEEKGLSHLYEETRGILFGDEVKRRIMLGTYVLSAGYYDAYYLRAQKVRRMIANDFSRVLQEVDVIACPVYPSTAFSIGEKTDDPLSMYLGDIYTVSVNLAGVAGLSVHTGFSSEKMPIGTQLIGRPFDEAVLFNTAFALESELNLNNDSPFVR